jgi:hypothetical protein
MPMWHMRVGTGKLRWKCSVTNAAYGERNGRIVRVLRSLDRGFLPVMYCLWKGSCRLWTSRLSGTIFPALKKQKQSDFNL